MRLLRAWSDTSAARADTIQFGTHGTLDGYGGSLKALRDLDAVRTLLERLPRELGMKIIAEPSVVQVGAQNEKDSGGVSGFVMIAESHISAHTFPSRRFISADVYTCQNSLDFDSIVKSFTDVFKLQDIEVHKTWHALSGKGPRRGLVALRHARHDGRKQADGAS